MQSYTCWDPDVKVEVLRFLPTDLNDFFLHGGDVLKLVCMMA